MTPLVMKRNERIDDIQFNGGMLCLDFINTVHDRKKIPAPDYLFHVIDLVAWAGKIGLVDKRSEALLNRSIAGNLKKSNQFFTYAINLRELLYNMFFAISQGKATRNDELKKFNAYIADHFSFINLKAKQGEYLAAWNLPNDSLQRITAPVVKDAYELLLSNRLDRVKECSNCGWLFLDTTKNGKRRWCSMKACGSTVKALEWYYRQKEKAS